MNKKSLAKVAGVGVASAALAMMVATSAQATGVTATASVAGNTSGPAVASLATSIGGINFTASANPSGNAAMSCSSVSLPGSVTPGATDDTHTFATINTGGTWSGCVGVGLHFAVTQNSAWHIGINGANFTDPISGDTMTPGVIPDVSATVSDTDAGGALCVFTVNGSVTGTFDNDTQELDVTASSLVSDIDPSANCLGLLKDPGVATFTGAFDITNSAGTAALPVSVTNP